MKAALEKAFFDTKSRSYFIVSDILAFFTILSIVSLVLETVPSLGGYMYWFMVIEWVAVVVFSVEYIARIMVTRPAWKYIFSFYGVIDLVSIAPTILGLGNFTFLKTTRTIRIIRLLRMVRLAKIARLKGRNVEEHMSFFTINIVLFLSVLISAVLAVGTLIYLVEGDATAFASIPLGMLWSFKVFLMGIPVAYPESVGGQVVHMAARFVGLTVFGVLVGVVGNVFREVLFGRK